MKALVAQLLIFLFILTTPNAFARGGGGGGSHGGAGGHSSSGYSSGHHSSGGHSSSHSSTYSGGHSSQSYSTGHSGRSSTTSHLGVSRHSSTSRTHYSGGNYKSGVAMVVRSETANHQFLAQRGLSRIPPGQNIDHIRPLSQGGSDTPSNMQLLSVEAHHQKTAAERRQY